MNHVQTENIKLEIHYTINIFVLKTIQLNRKSYIWNRKHTVRCTVLTYMTTAQSEGNYNNNVLQTEKNKYKIENLL